MITKNLEIFNRCFFYGDEARYCNWCEHYICERCRGNKNLNGVHFVWDHEIEE